MHSDRLGSILKSRDLHSAMQDSLCMEHEAGLTQRMQSFEVCAATRSGDIPPTNMNKSNATFTTHSIFGALPGKKTGEHPTGNRATIAMSCRLVSSGKV